MAAELGLSETVFVDDQRTGELQIFTPTTELEFAGHPTVGTAWLLRARRRREALRPPAGERGGALRGRARRSWRARPEWGPPYEFEQLGSPAEVEALDGPPGGDDLIGAWAWIDEAAGAVRARVFPRATGNRRGRGHGLRGPRLCALLGRPIDIRQGRGSRILARPLATAASRSAAAACSTRCCDDDARATSGQIRQVARPRFSR